MCSLNGCVETHCDERRYETMSKILVIEDDQTIIEGLKPAFEFYGFSLLIALDGLEGVRLYQKEKPELVILDVMLPGADGFEVCKKIRESDLRTPIIMLTAKSRENDKLLGFELGADDYITKPFSAKELIARVKAVLKRTGNETCRKGDRKGDSQEASKGDSQEARQEAPQEITVGNAVVNLEYFTVLRAGDEYTLSPKEHDILQLFVNNPETVVTRSRIIDEVWGEEYFPSPKTVDNFVVKLRGKIEDKPRNPRHIITVHGVGYKFRF
jgi:DNA-binding response OmpR family regulator